MIDDRTLEGLAKSRLKGGAGQAQDMAAELIRSRAIILELVKLKNKKDEIERVIVPAIAHPDYKDYDARRKVAWESARRYAEEVIRG
jgi:hypothetical protein